MVGAEALSRKSKATRNKTRSSTTQQSSRTGTVTKKPTTEPRQHRACRCSPRLPALIGSQPLCRTRSLSPIGLDRTWGGVRKWGPGDYREPRSSRTKWAEWGQGFSRRGRPWQLRGGNGGCDGARARVWMSGAGTERAESELEAVTGSARARALCARAARSSSEPPPGGRGGGGAGECVRLARARDGLPSAPPTPIPDPALGYHVPFSGQPSSSPRTSRPLTFLFAPPAGFPPIADCHSRVSFPGQGDLGWRNGDWEGALGVLPLPRRVHPWEIGPRGAGPKTPYAPPAGKFAQPFCPSTDLSPSQIFPKS